MLCSHSSIYPQSAAFILASSLSTTMSQQPNNKISEVSAKKFKPTYVSSGILNKVLLLLLVGFCAWAYKTAIPPPPKTIRSPTSPRIKLPDGRYLAYEEAGVPKHTAKAKIIFLHGFDGSKYHSPFVATASPALVEELGVYIVALDRPGYGESDPDPNRTVESFTYDIEEVADQLNLGPKFYVAGFSMGGMDIWSCLKYIPHRLAGAVLIAPGINFWWHNLPSNLTNEAYSRLLKQDQWAYRVAHYLPWLTYWWNTQKWFPRFSVIDKSVDVLSRSDLEALSKHYAPMDLNELQVIMSYPTQQGEFESLHRDFNLEFGKWDFDPMDLKNPFLNNIGSVHLWMGSEDLIVPVTLQRYIAQQLTWVEYHEINKAGHLLVYTDQVVDDILKALFNIKR